MTRRFQRPVRQAFWAFSVTLASLAIAVPARSSAQGLEHSAATATAGPVLPRHFAPAPNAFKNAPPRRVSATRGASIYLSTAAILIGAILLVILLV